MVERIAPAQEQPRVFRRTDMVIKEEPQTNFDSEKPPVAVYTQFTEKGTGKTYVTKDNGAGVEVVHDIAAQVNFAFEKILPDLKAANRVPETILFEATRVLTKADEGKKLTPDENLIATGFGDIKDQLKALSPLVEQQARQLLFTTPKE